MKISTFIASVLLIFPFVSYGVDVKTLKQQFAQSREFMIANATKDRVKTYRDGIQYITIKQGTGPVVGPENMIRLEYTIKSVQGHVNEASRTHFVNARALRSGWKALIKGQQEGTKLRIFVPPDTNYLTTTIGQRQAAADVKIVDAEIVNVYPAETN